MPYPRPFASISLSVLAEHRDPQPQLGEVQPIRTDTMCKRLNGCRDAIPSNFLEWREDSEIPSMAEML
jgi:hypothetical protein